MTNTETRSFRLVHPGDPRRVIRGKIDTPSGSKPGAVGRPHVLILHGFKGFMDWGFFPDVARRLASHGFAAVRFNVSGSGIGEDLESFSEPEAFAANTLSREIEDLELVRAWIRAGGAEGVDPARASIVGHSRGAGLALVHAAELGDLRCVATWAAVATFDRFDEPSKALWRRQGFLPILNTRTGQELPLRVSALEDLEENRDRFDVPAACRRLSAPALFAHGTADESVPIAESEILFASMKSRRTRLLRVEGTGHTFGVRHPMREAPQAWQRVVAATMETILQFG
jgi:pimeloyl-ACP methyl ester carboxylesterase